MPRILVAWLAVGVLACSSAPRPAAPPEPAPPEPAPPEPAPPEPTPRAEPAAPAAEPGAWARLVDWDERIRGATGVAVGSDGTIVIAGQGERVCFVAAFGGAAPRWTHWYGERGCECTGLRVEEDGAVTFAGLTSSRNTLVAGGVSTVPGDRIDPRTGREESFDTGLALTGHVTQLEPSGEVRWRRTFGAPGHVRGLARWGDGYVTQVASTLRVVEAGAEEVETLTFPGWDLSGRPRPSPRGPVLFGRRGVALGRAAEEAGPVVIRRGEAAPTLVRPVSLDPELDLEGRLETQVVTGSRWTVALVLPGRGPLRVSHGAGEDVELGEPGLHWFLQEPGARVQGDTLELLATRERRPRVDEAVLRYRLDLGSGHAEVAEYPLEGEVRVETYAWGPDGSIVLLASVQGEAAFDGVPHASPRGAPTSLVRLPPAPR